MKGSSAGWSAGGEENTAKPRIANSGGKGTRRREQAEGVATGQHPILGDLCTRLFIVIERQRQRLDYGHWPSACLPNMAHKRHDPVVRTTMSGGILLVTIICHRVSTSRFFALFIMPYRYFRSVVSKRATAATFLGHRGQVQNLGPSTGSCFIPSNPTIPAKHQR
jgi:hypothetical protein